MSELINPEHQQQLNDARRARLTHIVREMGKLFTPHHETPQSEEYEAWRMQYLQTMTDLQYPDLPDNSHSHWTTG